MDLVIALVTPFVGQPFRCGMVAAVFTAAAFLPGARRGQRVMLGVTAALWWLWTVVEMKVPGHAIRADLLLIGPVIIVVTAFGAWQLFRVLERAGLRPKL